MSGRHQAEQVSTRQDQAKAAVVVEETEEQNQSFSRGSYLGLTVKTLLEGMTRSTAVYKAEHIPPPAKTAGFYHRIDVLIKVFPEIAL